MAGGTMAVKSKAGAKSPAKAVTPATRRNGAARDGNKRPATPTPSRLRETALYPPVKRFLEAQGYEVKGEVAAADLVACRGDEPPLIVELKTGFSLTLFHQAIERQALSDIVYVAVPRGTGLPFKRSLAANKKLCRRLGLGLMTVRFPDELVEVHIDPAPYRPRKAPRKTGRLLREFTRRVGDPTMGGNARAEIMTAYRQDALRCLAHLAANGPTKAAHVATATGVATARRIMSDDHYGWFERVATGIYGLTPKGHVAVADYARHLTTLTAAGPALAPAGAAGVA